MPSFSSHYYNVYPLTDFSKNYKTQINPKKNSLKTQTMTDLLLGFGSLEQLARPSLFLQHDLYIRCKWGFFMILGLRRKVFRGKWF